MLKREDLHSEQLASTAHNLDAYDMLNLNTENLVPRSIGSAIRGAGINAKMEF